MSPHSRHSDTIDPAREKNAQQRQMTLAGTRAQRSLWNFNHGWIKWTTVDGENLIAEQRAQSFLKPSFLVGGSLETREG
jgi:hypothetical protein